MSEIRIAIDFGNVIMEQDPDPVVGRRIYLEEPLRLQPIVNAFRSIERLVQVIGSDNFFVVTRQKDEAHEKSLHAWLEGYHFFQLTGVKPEHLMICRERDEKAAICLRLKITHFVDDLLPILSTMSDKRFAHMQMYWMTSEMLDAADIFDRFPHGNLKSVFSWPAILEHIGV